MGLDLIVTARLDTEKAVNQNEFVCDSADTGLRTGSAMDTNQSPVGAALGGDSHKPRAHPANSQPVPPTTGLCSLIADQPDTLSSSCGLRRQACQESRSRVFYGWFGDRCKGRHLGSQPAEAVNESRRAAKRSSILRVPSTKAPCDRHSPALLPAARGKTFSADTSGTRPGIRTMTVDDSRSVLSNQDRRAGACVVSLSWH